MNTRIERIQQKLQILQPSKLTIRDDSHQHAGHAAAKGVSGDETHLRIEIHSPEFIGKSRIECHRMVQNLCKDEMSKGLHALQIIAKPVDESLPAHD